jgi:hypothetical protein
MGLLSHQISPEIFAQSSNQLKEKDSQKPTLHFMKINKNIVAKYGKQLEIRPNIIP